MGGKTPDPFPCKTTVSNTLGSLTEEQLRSPRVGERNTDTTGVGVGTVTDSETVGIIFGFTTTTTTHLPCVTPFPRLLCTPTPLPESSYDHFGRRSGVLKPL